MQGVTARGGAALAGVLLLAWLLSTSVTGTLAVFTAEVSATVSLTTGAVHVQADAMGEAFGPLVPGQAQDRTLSFRNDGSLPTDVYLWVQPSGDDLCASATGALLELQVAGGGWIRVCDLVVSASGAGAAAPLLLTQALPAGEGATRTLSLRLADGATDVHRAFSRSGDALVLFAIQAGVDPADVRALVSGAAS
jgi:hypothetical protein